MNDREKVINKVTAIVADMQEEVDEWKDYSDSELRGGLTCDCDWWYKTLQTLKDAIVLLKAQEPRVLTLEEVKTLPSETDVWLDEFCSIIVAATISCTLYGNAYFYGIEHAEYGVDYKLIDYGKEWRCWTSRPTDEQRKAVKWG